MHDTVVTPDEIVRRTVRHADWVPCKAAFIDCRTPGSDRKDNYSFIGPGVTQNSGQHVNLREPHGFNLGAAGPLQAFANGGAPIRRHRIQGREHGPGAHPSAPPKRSVHSAT